MLGIRLWRWVLVAAAAILTPGMAQAGLLGDEVDVTLEAGSTTIFSGSATVTAGIEFTFSFDGPSPPNSKSNWTLDIQDNGFVLQGTCQDPMFGWCDFRTTGITLSLSDLSFSPPASLLGLATPSGVKLAVDGTPLVTPSSIQIEFQAFEFGTNGGHPGPVSFQATFSTEPLASVSEPATILLVLVGAAGAGLVGLRRRLF